MVNAMAEGNGKNCESCIYFFDSGNPQGNCLRFARFVDHAVNETSRDCSYWEENKAGH